MVILKRILLLLLPLLSLTSCFTAFEPDLPSTPVLCMNSEISAGERIELYLSRTWRWSEGDQTSRKFDVTVADAEVSLYVGDRFIEHLHTEKIGNGYAADHPFYEETTAYVSDYVPTAGDHIRLEADSKKYGTARAETEIPFPVTFDKVDADVLSFRYFPENATDSGPYDGSYHMKLALQLWFTDPPAAGSDFYDFSVSNSPGQYSYFPDEDTRNSLYLYSIYFNLDGEPLFSEFASALDKALTETYGYTIFTDRQINGKSYPLKVRVEDVAVNYENPGGDPDIDTLKLHFTLKHVSEAYYKHVLSVWVVNDAVVGSLGSVGLGEPVYAYSNVSTGAGVVAGVASCTADLDLMDIIVSERKKQ